MLIEKPHTNWIHPVRKGFARESWAPPSAASVVQVTDAVVFWKSMGSARWILSIGMEPVGVRTCLAVSCCPRFIHLGLCQNRGTPIDWRFPQCFPFKSRHTHTHTFLGKATRMTCSWQGKASSSFERVMTRQIRPGAKGILLMLYEQRPSRLVSVCRMSLCLFVLKGHQKESGPAPRLQSRKTRILISSELEGGCSVQRKKATLPGCPPSDSGRFARFLHSAIKFAREKGRRSRKKRGRAFREVWFGAVFCEGTLFGRY